LAVASPTRPRPALAARDRRTGFAIPADYARTRGLEPHREAKRLVFVCRAIDDGKPVRLAPAAAKAWQRMRAAAEGDGVTLYALSGFRSVRRQTAIIREKLADGRRLEDILKLVAAPGFSEHHTGRALDIGSRDKLELDEHFARTEAFRWLARHAGRFGFVLSYPKGNRNGFRYEPWHWCWHRPAKSVRRAT
jgi:zinc D-Ala-D-Ala carboxypeptidase